MKKEQLPLEGGSCSCLFPYRCEGIICWQVGRYHRLPLLVVPPIQFHHQLIQRQLLLT
jgi:hypothetical protein